jgi:hypothetical protein
MKIVIDTYVLGEILGDAHASNRGATAGAVSANLNLGVSSSGPLAVVGEADDAADSNEVRALEVILRLGQALDEQNIPGEGRWIVCPTWFAAALKRSELRQAYLSGDSVSMLRNGRLGMIDRFTLYVSNLLPTGTAGGLASGEFAVYAGHAHGLTFASQISKVETLQSEMTFGTILRGLQVFGHKTVDSTAIAEAIVKNEMFAAAD